MEKHFCEIQFQEQNRHIPVFIYIVTDLLKTLIGGGLVNTFQHTRFLCFLCVRPWTLAMQRTW
jgi:hypothetical protein